MNNFEHEHSVEHLTTAEQEKSAEEIAYEAWRYVNYDQRTQKKRPYEQEAVFEKEVSILPREIIEAIKEYLDAREINLWNGLESTNYNDKVRVSDKNRREKHDKAASMLVEWNPEKFPDAASARDYINSLTGDGVSAFIIDYYKD